MGCGFVLVRVEDVKKYIHAVLFSVSIILSACAFTPDEVMRQGSVSTFRSAHAPREAAACVAHNAGEVGSQMSAQVIDEGKAGLKVIVRMPGSTIAMAVITRAGTGSAVSVYVSSNIIPKKDFAAGLANGC